MDLDYIKYSNSIADNFWKYYKNEFLAGALDCNDLRQEANICAWKVVQKYKNEEQRKNIKFIVRGAVKQRLSEIKRDINRKISSGQKFMFNDEELKERQELKLTSTLYKYINFVPIDDEKNGNTRLDKFCPIKIPLRYLEAKTDNPRINIILDFIESILTEDEWNVFYGKVIEDKTFQELSKSFKRPYSNMGIYKIYQKALKKIRKKIKK